MVYNIFTYRRPARVGTIATSKLSASPLSPSPSNSIPDALSFDRIVAGGTCPPMTSRDFLSYLQYVEHCAENLQFYLWLRDYTARFDGLPSSEKALAKEWTPAPDAKVNLKQAPPVVTRGYFAKDRAVQQLFTRAFTRKQDSDPTESLETLSPTQLEKTSPWDTQPQTPNGAVFEGLGTSFMAPSSNGSIMRSNHKQVTAGAFNAAEVPQPFTIQPFREEVSRIIAIYIAENSPRELNISARDRATVMAALSNTTHPSAFRPINQAVEDALRLQSHPNFVRWSICNGNRPRVIFARALGIALILAGFVVAILLTLSHYGRGWRALAAIAWVAGISTLVAAWKGMCVVLHGLHHRHFRPWELWTEDEGEEMKDSKSSLDSIASNSSYEDEPWAQKYAHRSVLRKIFDKETWIEEPALRQIQDTIALQSLLCALLGAAVLTGVFVALPRGNYF